MFEFTHIESGDTFQLPESIIGPYLDGFENPNDLSLVITFVSGYLKNASHDSGLKGPVSMKLSGALLTFDCESGDLLRVESSM
jgi:hypothetical protein